MTKLLYVSDSDWIAGEMVAIDGPYNGWRNLVLPMAHADELVMNAVLTSAAFHLTIQGRQNWHAGAGFPCLPNPCVSKDQLRPEYLYNLTIKGLQRTRDSVGSDHEVQKTVLMTILILLATTMINGGEEFPALFEMMQAVTMVLGGEEQIGGSDLGDFMIRQVRNIDRTGRMRVYAAPHISEKTGFGVMSSQPDWDQIFECLRYCSQSQPTAQAPIRNVVQQAHDIYLRQVRRDPRISNSVESIEESVHRLERFKKTLQAFPKDAPGSNSLVWATFIAASDCTLQEHKEFFVDVIMQHFHRSRFGNLLKGIRHLQYVWAQRSEGARWTNLLPQSRMFLA
ncbi:unnamed protein product [Clonostachys rosea]|uniref:Uncharacterized protein n=1 Tax=Bionectria ochroleuca TaxID=29856 RepID=A0ABY6UHH1_BIOOC|nr:unnamed protein product [Clonostachys rosea]